VLFPATPAAIKKEDAMPRKLLSEQEVTAIWQAYAQHRANALRDRLVEHYLDLGLVRRAAKRMARTLPCQVDPDELLSAGAFGLLAAVERFEPTRGIKFTTFARQPISGAMVDYLREIDHLSRVARSQANQLSNTTESLKMNLGRPPGEEEIRRHLGVSEETLLRMGQTSRQGINLSLQHRYRNRRDGDSFATIETLSVDDGFNSMRLAMKHDVREWIVQGLSRRHRLIVVLYYYEGMSMREIGDTLGMSESRVSQLHATIITRLQRRLRDRDQEFIALSA
jgi:RNA polymerase sigma factor for flagellar operon FliA